MCADSLAFGSAAGIDLLADYCARERNCGGGVFTGQVSRLEKRTRRRSKVNCAVVLARKPAVNTATTRELAPKLLIVAITRIMVMSLLLHASFVCWNLQLRRYDF